MLTVSVHIKQQVLSRKSPSPHHPQPWARAVSLCRCFIVAAALTLHWTAPPGNDGVLGNHTAAVKLAGGAAQLAPAVTRRM